MPHDRGFLLQVLLHCSKNHRLADAHTAVMPAYGMARPGSLCCASHAQPAMLRVSAVLGLFAVIMVVNSLQAEMLNRRQRIYCIRLPGGCACYQNMHVSMWPDVKTCNKLNNFQVPRQWFVSSCTCTTRTLHTAQCALSCAKKNPTAEPSGRWNL